MIQLEASTFYLTLHFSPIKLIKTFTEEVPKFSSCILYQLRLILLAMNNSNGKHNMLIKRLPPLFPILRISNLYITCVHHAANQDSKSKRAIALMCK